MNPYISAAIDIITSRGGNPQTKVPMRRTENILPMREEYPMVCFIANALQAQNTEGAEDVDFQI